MKISMKLAHQYIAIFFNFSPTSSHLHPLQVKNCDSNSWLVVDEDDNGKFRLERVKHQDLKMFRRLGAKGSYLTLVRVADRIL